MKKKIFKKKHVVLISIMAAIIILSGIVSWTLLDHGENVETPTDQTESIEQVSPTEEVVYESIPPEMYEEVNGIPRINFESTKDREFDFYLKNNKTNQRWEINGNELYGSIDYKFADISSEQTFNKEMGIDSRHVVPARSAVPVVELLEGSPESRFIFGVLNERTENANAHDCPIIYIEFCGNDDWNLCGIHTGMKYDEVVELLGTPSQEVPVNKGYAIDYFVMGDEHTYNIHIILDSKDGKVTDMVLNIDNYSIYSNQTLDEMGR